MWLASVGKWFPNRATKVERQEHSDRQHDRYQND
jgi:hypothetical protein